MKRMEVRIKRIERSMDPEGDELKAAMEEINRLMTDVYGPIPGPQCHEDLIDAEEPTILITKES